MSDEIPLWEAVAIDRKFSGSPMPINIRELVNNQKSREVYTLVRSYLESEMNAAVEGRLNKISSRGDC